MRKRSNISKLLVLLRALRGDHAMVQSGPLEMEPKDVHAYNIPFSEELLILLIQYIGLSERKDQAQLCALLLLEKRDKASMYLALEAFVYGLSHKGHTQFFKGHGDEVCFAFIEAWIKGDSDVLYLAISPPSTTYNGRPKRTAVAVEEDEEEDSFLEELPY